MTIAVDTSAVMAILLGEDDAETFAAALDAHAGDILVSAAGLVEMRIVARTKQGPEAVADLDTLLATVNAETVPFDRAQADVAASAWSRFGRGRHPAALNFGDCLSYALARSCGASLLSKGNDFTQTDVPSAL